MKTWDTLGRSVMNTRTFEVVAEAKTFEAAHMIVEQLESSVTQADEIKRLKDALRQSNETLKVAGMDDIGGGIAKLIAHNSVLLLGHS